MRNFKKFLALVLAMLMVSACAVSVSAFDDIDEDIYYAEAVDLLATLGVIKGRNDGTDNFYPNDTLTREEAAVIAAKLIAGDDAPEWAAQTTEFVDVVDTWSFAYINYAYANGAMIGIGDSKFEPKRNLQIDEALKIALAVADPNALRQATINMNANPTGYWADHFIIAASNVGVTEENREAGLLKDIPVIRNYEADCTRGMFAQIMANAFYFGEGIMEGFDYVSMKATVAVDADKKYVTISDTAEEVADIKVTYDFFNAALKAEGYTDITASDLTNGSYINVVALKTAKEIASLEVLTDIDVVKYSDDMVITHVMKDATNVDAAVIEIDGIKYTVGAEDSKGTSGAWGEAATPIRGIELTVIDVANTATVIGKNAVTKTTVPAYYEAFLYNDDGDNDYERAVIKAYEIATLSKGGEFDHDNDANTAKLNGTIINYVAGTSTTDAYMTLDGAACTAWGNTPKLVRVEGNAILVLETADTTTTGVVSNFREDSYINIGDKKVEFADKFVNPAKWVLGQNVAIYTIGGEYVNVVNEDVTTGMKPQSILVDNVTVENGVALIDGYIWNAGVLTAVEDFKVVGVVENEKLVSKAFAALKVVKNEKTYAGVVGNGVLEENGEKWKTAPTVTFEDGKSYTFNVTNAGAYYAGRYTKGDIANLSTEVVSKNVEIKNGYFYVDGTAKYKLADTYTVLTKKNATDAGVLAYDEYAAYSYVTLDSFKFEESKVRVWGVDLAKATAYDADKKIAFVYADSASNEPVPAKQTKLNAGETIVKIVSVENEALAESTYNASDIFTGAKVTVTGNATVGEYALVKDGKIIDADTLWVKDNMSLNITVAFDGKSVKGQNTMIVDPVGDGDDQYLAAIEADTTDKKVTFGLDAIKYWAFDDKGEFIKEAADFGKLLTKTGTMNFTGCIIDGTVVILSTPAYAAE